MKLPKLVQQRIERLDKEIERVWDYMEQCGDLEDRHYWNCKLDRLRRARFLMQVFGHGLVAMSKGRKRRRK